MNPVYLQQNSLVKLQYSQKLQILTGENQTIRLKENIIGV